MRFVLAALACLLTTGAHAALLGSVELPNGSIDVYDDAGPCKAQAKRAVYVPAVGDQVPGCWVRGGGIYFVVFMDADIARIPVSDVKPPKSI